MICRTETDLLVKPKENLIRQKKLSFLLWQIYAMSSSVPSSWSSSSSFSLLLSASGVVLSSSSSSSLFLALLASLASLDQSELWAFAANWFALMEFQIMPKTEKRKSRYWNGGAATYVWLINYLLVPIYLIYLNILSNCKCSGWFVVTKCLGDIKKI